jgi:hypothetical protein
MDFSIYRIFPDLGDSIMLCTLFKHKDISRVFYNRADLAVLKQIMKIYDLPDTIEFIQTSKPIRTTMVSVYSMMANERLHLISPVWKEGEREYWSYQLGSNDATANDRSITIDEVKSHIPLDASIMSAMNTQNPKYLPKNSSDVAPLDGLFDLMSNSSRHITCDSGTAWVAASMGIETIIISKNSLYFPSAHFAMKYANIHKNVTVYQEGIVGVRSPSAFEYNTICAARIKQPLMSYPNFIKAISESNPK